MHIKVALILRSKRRGGVGALRRRLRMDQEADVEPAEGAELREIEPAVYP